MTEPAVPWTLEALRANEAWLRPLLRSLVDEATADDVLQQTWVQAFRRPPRAVGSWRVWLARVATNFARSHRRKQRRHERAAAMAVVDVAESTAAVVERLSLHRSVSQAVLELPEPYRSVVLLRHYHDLDIAAIAVRVGATEVNVRQRLHRGHEWLRQRLRTELGEPWRAHPAVRALLASPLWSPPAAAPSAAVMVLAMNKIRFFAVAAIVVGLLGVVALTNWAGRDPLVADPGQSTLQPVGVTTADAADSSPQPSTRERLLTANPSARPAPAPVRGVVVDVRERPIGGVAVAFRHDPQPTRQPAVVSVLATSDAAGQVTFPDAWPGPFVEVLLPWVALAVQPPSDGPDPQPAQLIVAPARAQAVRVVTTDGTARPGAVVTVDNFALRDFPRLLEDATQRTWPTATTDAAGRCHFDQLATLATFVTVRCPGFESQRLPIDAATPDELLVELQPIPVGARRITGVVTDARGAFVAQARVGLGARTTATDRHGAYSLRIEPGERISDGELLWAASPGWFTASLLDFGMRVNGMTDATMSQDLQLTQLVLTIGGRVLDHEGKPCIGALVYPWELEQMTGAETAEDLAAAADIEPLNLNGNEVRAFARTDADGAFAISAFGARSYRLRVHDQRAGWAWTSQPIDGGATGVVVQLPKPTIGRVAGRAVTRDGQPAADVLLIGLVEVFAAGGGRVSSGLPARAITDANGRFEIAAMPRLGAQLSISGDAWIEDMVSLDQVPDPEAIQLPMQRRCHFRVECTGAAWADARVRVLDADGQVMMLTERRRSTVMSRQEVDLHEGKSGALAVSEIAATVVLTTRDSRREHRVPVAFRTGDVNPVIVPIE